jgi:hypothetical protein
VSAVASVARARCSALLIEAVLVSSSSAASLACHLSTSQRISAARCFAGRCCSAATKASRSVSRCSASSSGVGSGVIHVTSGSSARFSNSGSCAGPRSIGRARFSRPFSWSKQTFVAMRYSHDLSAARPSNLSSERQARSIVSWTASSASKAEPSMR